MPITSLPKWLVYMPYPACVVERHFATPAESPPVSELSRRKPERSIFGEFMMK